MSKNKHSKNDSGSHLAGAHAEEYKIIRQDLMRVILLNAVYLTVILSLYFTNNKSHYLELWFDKIF